MKRLEEMLNKIEESRTDYYQGLITMHNSKALRGLTQVQSLTIVQPRYNSDNGLYFGGEGFYANIPKYLGGGDYRESGTYKQCKYNFKVKSNILVTRTHKGKYELLSLFPSLTPETIEEKLCNGIEKVPMYKNLEEEK